MVLRIDNTIDLITNSSSELFVIKSTKQKEVIIKMLEKALEGIYDYTINLDGTIDVNYNTYLFENQLKKITT